MRTVGARSLNRLIDIYVMEQTADGVGGSVASFVYERTAFCNIKQQSTTSSFSAVSTGEGILSGSKSILITLRKDDNYTLNVDFNQVKYLDDMYAIASEPILADDDSFIQFIAKKI